LSREEGDRVARGLEAQFAALAAKRAAGAELIGWKIGLNAAPVQRHLGLSSPVIGHLTSTSLVAAGSTHELAGATRPGVEPEVAIRVGPGGSVASLGPAIELVDLDPAITELEPILAGNVFHRGVVLGPEATGDLGELVATVKRNGAVEQQTAFAETGEDPEAVVAIVSERLELVGEELRDGQVIIGGSLTPIVSVKAGDLVEVELGALGSLSLRLA
jgi:2-keto-4-pentenoate hydratase